MNEAPKQSEIPPWQKIGWGYILQFLLMFLAARFGIVVPPAPAPAPAPTVNVHYPPHAIMPAVVPGSPVGKAGSP